jgi:hypothetical protein
VRSARRALGRVGPLREHCLVVIASVQPIPALPWPAGWEDVEVVDSVLVDAPAPARDPIPEARTYNRFGRVAESERFGRLVSVVA